MPTITRELKEHKLFQGETFVGYYNADLGSPGDMNIYAQAPANKHILVYFGQATWEDDVTLTVYDTVSGVSGGSALDVNNNHIGSSITTDGTYSSDVSFTGDTVHQRQKFFGSGAEQIFDGYKILIAPGEEAVIELVNDGAGNNEGSIRIAFMELRLNE